MKPEIVGNTTTITAVNANPATRAGKTKGIFAEQIRIGDSVIKICPGFGGNILSWTIRDKNKNDVELAWTPLDLNTFSGNPNDLKMGEIGGLTPPLTPFAGRVTALPGIVEDVNVLDRITDIKKNNGVHIHGAGFYRQWKPEEITTRPPRNTIATSYSFDTRDKENEDIATVFGKYKVTNAYIISERKIEVETTIENFEKRPLQMSFGFHSYFNTPNRSNWHIYSKASSQWQAEANIPTGYFVKPALFPNEAIGERTNDSIFTDLDFNSGFSTSSLYNPQNQLTISMTQSDFYQNRVIFIPPSTATEPKEFVCMEAQTSSADPFRLSNAGIEKANLLTIPPRGKVTGKVVFSVETLLVR